MVKTIKNILSVLLLLLVVSCASNKPNVVTGSTLSSTGLCENNNIDQSDHEAIPCMIMQPRYPRAAALDRIMGHVRFSFTVSETGLPVDLEIVESVPEGVFNRVAMVAMTQWQFKPKKVNGSAVRQESMTYLMEFKVE